MYTLVLLVLLSNTVERLQAQAVANEDWKLNDLINFFSNDTLKDKPIGSVLSDLTKKASGEFDKIYHQLESVLKQLTTNGPVVATQLDPSVINDKCSCYCRCPHKSLNSKVINDVKLKVMDLKERFKSVGKTIKDKIHTMTSR